MESLILERNRSDRPNELVFGLFTSIILHSVLLIGGSYWLKVKAPEQKQDLSDAIPIEYIEVPANETKKPPETSRRAARDSVAGGEAKPEKAISIAKSAPTTSAQSNKDLPTPESADVLQPQPTQPKPVSPNLSAQKPQPKPAKIAVAPKITQPKLQPESTALTPDTIPPIPKPQPTALTRTTPPIPKPQPTTVNPTTTSLESKLRQFATARNTQPVPKPQPTALTPDTTPPVPKPEPTALTRTTPPKPKPQPTTDTPTTTALESKLRQFATARTTPPEPQPQPTALTPDPTPLVPKQQPTALTRTTPPQPQPTTDTPTTTPLESKLRQFATARSIKPIPQTTVTTGTPPTPKRPKIAVAPTTPPVSTRQTAFTPTTKSPGRLTRPQKKNQLAANTSSVPGTRTTTRTSTRSQPFKGGSSSLGGPVALSSRNFADYADANSNRQNQGTEGIDARKDADIGPYLQQLQEKVKQQWIPGVTQSSLRTVLHFTITRSGQVKYLEVAQSSGFDVTDEAALGAVKRATPFAPLPANYTDNYLNIRFTFNINIYGELELWGG